NAPADRFSGKNAVGRAAAGSVLVGRVALCEDDTVRAANPRLPIGPRRWPFPTLAANAAAVNPGDRRTGEDPLAELLCQFRHGTEAEAHAATEHLLAKFGGVV